MIRSRQFQLIGCAILSLACVLSVPAQDIDNETDPIRLFERGQDAHAKNDYKSAIQLYEAAIKLKPEFPEAEFQRAIVLLATNQESAAVQGFNRAVTLRPQWPMAYAKFGSVLASDGKFDADAEPILRRAIELDDKNLDAMVALAVVKQRRGDLNEAVKLIRLATSLPDAKANTWRSRAYIENAAGDTAAAISSITHGLDVNPKDVSLRYDRARLLLAIDDRTRALSDLDAVKSTMINMTDAGMITELVQLYARAGKPDESLRLLDGLSEMDRKRPEVVALRGEIAGDARSSAEEREALENLLQRDPKNTSLLAQLGNAYRTIDPQKSLDYYGRALQIDPKNAGFATGYAAALVQLRHFADAVGVLRGVIQRTPDDHAAHANLAIALYELKDYAAALQEYEWLKAERPEIAVTYFYIATAHDKLAQYQDALDAYEKFLSLADSNVNKLEIDKVNLRLPSLRNQIKRGQGRTNKKS